MFNWEEFLDPYVQTVGELKIKFRGVRKQYLKKGLYSPIEFVTGRVKRRESIRNKAKLRGYTRENLSEMEDIAGVRVMVQFVDDVWDVLELLRKRKDFKIIEERDYINNQKPQVIVLIMSLLNIRLIRLMASKLLMLRFRLELWP